MAADHYSHSMLRTGAAAFIVGRSTTAVLSLIILAITARALSVSDFGAYVTALAIVEVAVACSTFGLDWVGITLLPEYRVHASEQRLRMLVLRLVAIRLISLVIAAVAILAAFTPLLEFFSLDSYGRTMQLFVVLILAEGIGRFMRDVVLASVFRQTEVQASQLVRNASFCLMLTLLVWNSELTLLQVAAADVCASLLSFLAATIFTLRYFSRQRVANENDKWQPPAWRAVLNTAWHNYLSLLLSMLYGTQALLFFANRLLGIEAAALFGFARNLAEQVRRYLPADLLLGVVRPMVIARYSEEQDFARLNQRIGLLYKLSLFGLAPLLMFFAVFGTTALDLFSNGKYGAAAPYLFGLLLALIPFSHRRLLELTANTVRQAGLWSRAAFIGLLAIPLALILIHSGFGLAGLIGAMIVAELATNIYLVYGLRRLGYLYRVEWRGFAALVLCASIAALAVYPLVPIAQQWGGLAIAAAGSAAVFLLLAYFIKPFRHGERASLNRILKYEFFIW